MTKKMLVDFLSSYEDNDEIDEYELSNYLRDIEEERERRIEELEERQHNFGLYAFNDMLDMMRAER